MNEITEYQKEKNRILSKGQFAISAGADFEDGTWTFQMTADKFVVAAGEFVLIPKKDFEEILAASERSGVGENEAIKKGCCAYIHDGSRTDQVCVCGHHLNEH